jgi:hypothetical protein
VAWLVWSAAQVGVLALMRWRVPLAANFPEPIEDASLVAMVLVQLILATVMCPVLLKSLQDWAHAIAVALPLIMLAGLLSDTPVDRVILAMVSTVLWLGVMQRIARVKWDAMRMSLIAVTLLLSAGGPVLFYLSQEFVRPPIGLDGAISWISPTLGAIASITQSERAWQAFIVPIALIGLDLLRSRPSQKKPPPLSPTAAF